MPQVRKPLDEAKRKEVAELILRGDREKHPHHFATKGKTMNGKGDSPRPVDAKKYRENYDRIFSRDKPRQTRCVICGGWRTSPDWKCDNPRCRLDSPGVL
jgi:hypothetical protein